ncbi:MAG: oligosaccharide flippase family protein [Candidatus Brocadiia bacterium]
MFGHLLRRLFPVQEGNELKKLLLKGASIAVVLHGSGVGLRYLFHLFFARYLGKSGYGAVSFSLGLAQLLSVVAILGLSVASLRFVSTYLSPDRLAELKGYIRFSRILVFGLGIVLAVCCTVIVWATNFKKIDPATVFVGVGLIPLFSLMLLHKDMLRALRKIGRALVIPNVILFLVPLLCTSILARWHQLASTQAMLFFLAGLIFGVGLQFFWIRKELPEGISQARAKFHPGLWLSVGSSLLVVNGAAMALQRVDIIMLGSMSGAAETGIYSAATRTAKLCRVPLLAANAVVAPLIATLYAKGELDRLQHMVNKVVQFVFWPSLFLAIFLIVKGEFVLALFGEGFEAGMGALAILVLARLLGVTCGPVAHLLHLTDLHYWSAAIFSLAALLNVALNAILIPRFGIEGAGVATAVSWISCRVMLVFVARWKTGIHSFILFR